MKHLLFLLSLILCLLLPIKTQAKDFTSLSTEQMESKVDGLVKQIAKDSGIQNKLYTSCYDWPESNVLSYNTLITYTICVNLSGFRTTADADLMGVSVDYYLVYTLAHEVRHSYQWEHQFDNSDYGRACKLGFESYQAYNGDKTAYYQQFIEADAEEFAKSYAEKYFKLVR